MRTGSVVLAVTALLLLCVAASHADVLVNPGFETGDLTGWTTVLTGGSADVVTTWPGATATYLPPEASHFLAIGGGDADTPELVYQGLNLLTGDLLDGWAAFDSWDEEGFYDWAAVEIYDANDVLVATPWYEDVGTIGEDTSGPWTYWSWNAPTDGFYYLAYSSANYDDDLADSYGLFDANGEPPPIPEPGTMALLLMGLPMASLLRRRK